jgi:Enoyl-[acyl-carrier-protein] reductase (NADH)
MINLAGKKGVIMGVANELSIAWGIAKQLSDNGAELCFTYQGDALFKRVKPLAESIQDNFFIECNVLNESSVKKYFNQVRERWKKMILF